MEKLKENKGFIIITTLLTLAPMFAGILLWQKLPDQVATHFGSGNEPNGWSSKGFAVFGIPLFIAAAHLLCVFASVSDPKHKGISSKLFRLTLLICPLTSLVCGAAIYGYALSIDIDLELCVKLFLGLLFIVIGNYLPKCRQNYTVGIKIPWTLHDEENWNHTHRLAGRLWMFCGLCMILNAFLPFGEAWLLPALLAVMVVVPVGYSLGYYLRHR